MKTLQYTIKTSGQKIFNGKTGIFCITLLILAWTYAQPYLNFVREKGHPISWCIFPFQMTSYSILSFFYFGIIYINSDVPFMQHANMYQVIRSGRRRWAAGQIGGILSRSFFAVVFCAAAALLPFAGRIECSAEWGKVVKTLASLRELDDFSLEMSSQMEFRFFYEILGEFTPVQLMLVTLLLCALICTFLGILMFFVSLFAGKMPAVGAALTLVAALFVVENIHGEWKQIAAYFVPTYWAEVALSATPQSGRYRLPPIPYMFIFLLIGILLMSLLIIWKVKRMEFNWENEDA